MSDKFSEYYTIKCVLVYIAEHVSTLPYFITFISILFKYCCVTGDILGQKIHP